MRISMQYFRGRASLPSLRVASQHNEKIIIVMFRFPTLVTGDLLQIFELMNFRSIDIHFYKIKVVFCQEVKNILHEL